MEQLLDSMIAAGVIVLATPVYFYTMCAQMTSRSRPSKRRASSFSTSASAARLGERRTEPSSAKLMRPASKAASQRALSSRPLWTSNLLSSFVVDKCSGSQSKSLYVLSDWPSAEA